jgi:uncharacterized membrane protein YeaQ/YmgE (transglycosylase-associated protein family)
MEQILINLVAGALGGNAVGKASQNFDLGTLGNTIAGLVGGGVLGQIITLVWPAVATSIQSGNFDIGSIIAQVVGGRRRWCDPHSHRRSDQKPIRLKAISGGFLKLPRLMPRELVL